MKTLRLFLVTSLLTLILSACATTTTAPTKKGVDLQQQAARYNEARELFLGKHYSDAALILMPLAQQGHSGAQYSIGYMYYYGYGVPHNEREAMHWIGIAAARGELKAQQALKIIESQGQKQSLPK